MAGNGEVKHVYEFCGFRLDSNDRVLTRNGQPVQLAPKILDTLLILVERNGVVLEKDELMRLVWPDSFVEENNLSQNIFHLRKVLGKNSAGQSYIETINRRGYRFTAEVKNICRNEREMTEARQIETGVINNKEESAAITIATPARRWIPGPAFKLGLAGATLIVILIFAIKFAWLGLLRFSTSGSSAAFSSLRIAKLTNAQDVRGPAMSRDGKYIAYAVVEGDRQSIRIRQTAAMSDAQVVAPADVMYRGLAFSSDGDFLYYTAYEKNGTLGALYRTPVLGGLPQRLIDDVDSPVTFSPDGKRLAFIRNYIPQKEVAIILANTDGGGAERLAVRQRPAYYALDGPAWSPDGKLLACAAGNFDAPVPYMTLIGVDAATGKETPLTSRRLSHIGQVAWLNDGRGLVAIVGDSTSPLCGDQLWHFSFPGGEPRYITNDPNTYRWLSLPANSNQFVTVQASRAAHIQVAPDGDAVRVKDITFGSGDDSGEKLGLTWTSGGQIIYASHLNGNTDLWMMDANGANRRQLTIDAGLDYQPASAPDGHSILFTSTRAGGQSNIWQMDISGANAKQLTFGKDDECSAVTPDGKWVIYTTRNHGQWTMWKAPMDGGTAIQLTKAPAQKPTVSPDGKLIACFYYDYRGDEQSRYRLALLPVEGGQPIKYFDAAAYSLLPVYWTPDGRALMYVDTRDGVSNVWRQPIDGGPPRQITDFKSGRIFRFAWSPDSKMLACERGTVVNDLALITQP